MSSRLWKPETIVLEQMMELRVRKYNFNSVNERKIEVTSRRQFIAQMNTHQQPEPNHNSNGLLLLSQVAIQLTRNDYIPTSMEKNKCPLNGSTCFPAHEVV